MKNTPVLRFLLLAVLLALAGCQGRNVPPPRTAANDFIQALAESRFEGAYDSTTYAFQAQTNLQSFRAVAREMELAGGGVSCRWDKEERADQEVTLTGEITGTGGRAIPVVLRMVNERGCWRVLSLRDKDNPDHQEVDRFSLVGKGAAFTRSSNLEVPPRPALEKLVQESMLLFNDAIVQNNFGDFYAQVSAAWQRQLTVGQLKRGFQPFIDAKVNLSAIEPMVPVLEAPTEVDTKGILTLKGHYDTKPLRTDFTLRYTYEFPFWKLYGIVVEITDPAAEAAKTGTVPAPAPEAAPASPAPSATASPATPSAQEK